MFDSLIVLQPICFSEGSPTSVGRWTSRARFRKEMTFAMSKNNTNLSCKWAGQCFRASLNNSFTGYLCVNDNDSQGRLQMDRTYFWLSGLDWVGPKDPRSEPIGTRKSPPPPLTSAGGARLPIGHLTDSLHLVS